MIKLFAIVFLPLCLANANPGMDTTGLTEADISITSICDAENAEEVIQMSAQCITDPIMNKGIGDCRGIAYGDSDQFKSKDIYCAKSASEKAEMDELFEVCLEEAGINSEAIQTEWVVSFLIQKQIFLNYQLI